MNNRRIKWTAFTAVSIACAYIAYLFFPTAFPIVSVDISMTRELAIEKALDLSHEHGWGPVIPQRDAASFETNIPVKTFVELEAGGIEGFARLLDDSIFSPYTWRVRLFSEGVVNETTVRFRPNGRPYGFREKIAEDEKRPNIDAAVAKEAVEAAAIDVWRIDLAGLELTESGQDEKPNGRIDHRFVYESPRPGLGDGRLQVRARVSGDRVSMFMPSVRVPESFTRRYQEMRSANNSISTLGQVGMFLLLIVSGVGLYHLSRRGKLVWRPAIIAAGLIAALQIAASLNTLPLAWLSYDTSDSASGFLIQTTLSSISSSLLFALILALSFIAAEGLSRLAFPDHPQLWRLWSREAASSKSVAARTSTGYLLVPINLVFVISFYFIAQNVGDWWNPSDTLVSPDSLAHFAPWLNPFALSLQAGFWEECLFRAVPLATAALLGQRYGHRGLFITIAFVLQILIFGAGHANYPAQPAYARVVELVVPSVIFGLLYLRYGLLPAIIMHFAFNIVLMGLPIFYTTGPGVWFDRSILVLLAFLPIPIILLRRYQIGGWSDLPGRLRNGGWQPSTPVSREPPVVLPAQTSDHLPTLLLPALIGFCVVAIPLAYWLNAESRTEIPTIEITRSEALAISRSTLAAQSIETKPGGRELVSVSGINGTVSKFLWQTAGEETYTTSLGSWLQPPRYFVRFARFDGNVADRAEEWGVTVRGDGTVLSVQHRLPENAPGLDLTEADARALAHAALERELLVSNNSLRELSVIPTKQPSRTDWSFTFADVRSKPLPRGERRYAVRIAGNEIVSVNRFIHIPEDWRREQRSNATTMSIVMTLVQVVTLCLNFGGAIVGIVAWSRGNFSIRHFVVVATSLFILGLVGEANGFPMLTASFTTAQPFVSQVWNAIAFALIQNLIPAILTGLTAGMIVFWCRNSSAIKPKRLLLTAVLVGLVTVCISALALLQDLPSPRVSAVFGAGFAVPFAAPITQWIVNFIVISVRYLLIFGIANYMSRDWTRWKAFTLAGVFLIGGLAMNSGGGSDLPTWTVSAILSGTTAVIGYWLLVRRDLATVPIIVATTICWSVVTNLGQPYPGALAGHSVAVIIVATMAWVWFNALRRTT